MAKDNNFIIIGFDFKSYAFLNMVNRKKNRGERTVAKAKLCKIT